MLFSLEGSLIVRCKTEHWGQDDEKTIRPAAVQPVRTTAPVGIRQ
jgi:hypothetical protein